ncbi:acetyltransferase [Paenibacillus alvei TS-15]|uniref:Acetyltransferase n=1 Tax=Paenibacillus alvei TS-15 TaxID=1117108 RepID=S9U3E5_PAEAL|nr:GNAT family N-acetyltransferase [Paenibacillus alvei]EPY09061.1 acetyltransferase [Paenibacillus alvei TS-15]
MSEFVFIKDYKEIEKYRVSFNALAQESFGIQFEDWYQRRCWNDRYICYSYVDGDRVVANVSVNVMDIVIKNEIHEAIMIGTVMTDEAYRNQGLSRKLMEIVIEEYQQKCSFMYLYANRTVLDFYPKFGFHRVQEPEFYSVINTLEAHSDRPHMRKLNVMDVQDWELVMRYYSSRNVRYSTCDAIHAEGIFSWYCLHVFESDLYFDEELDAVVIFMEEGKSIQLYDVLSPKQVDLSQVVNKIATEQTERVYYQFHPEQGGYRVEYPEPSDDNLFMLPNRLQSLDYIKLPKIAQA